MQHEYQSPMTFKKATFDFARFEKPITKATSERASIIESFVTKLNNSRTVGGYKPLLPGFYASKMSHIPTEELYPFYKKLDAMKNFSSGWWYFCNPKK